MTEQEKKDVQKAFFEMGYKWRGRESTYQELDKPFYFAEGHNILYCSGADYFFNHKDCEDNKEITYKELMTLAYGEDTMSTQKEFTKSELKDGMVVVYRDGDERYVFGDTLFLLHEGLGAQLYRFNEDLTHLEYETMDIVEVKYMGESLWKRSEQTEQQKQLAELKAAQEQLLLQAKEISDKIDALQQS